jgi:clan AA aspartic protease (TIGR02281 family)
MTEPTPKKSVLSGALKLVVLFLMIGFWVWFFEWAPVMDLSTRFSHAFERLTGKVTNLAPPPTELSAPVMVNADGCESSLPPNGSQFSYPQAKHQQNKLHSRFYVSNEHLFPMLLILSDSATAARFKVVMVHPRQSSQVQLPAANYDLKVQVGLSWCNLSKGFINGAEVIAPQTLEIKGAEVANLRLMPFGDAPADIMFSYSKSLGVIEGRQDQRPEGVGVLNLQRVVGGHYAVEGSINQVPINFMVDTGATITAVSSDFAKHAGVTDCEPYKTQTANGVVNVCLGTAREMTIGQFRLKNVKVSYSNGLGNTFLLGMNVIGQFRMEQQGDVMRLTLH